MIKNRAEARRVLLALTEANSIPDLWQAAAEHLGDEGAELVTVVLRDDRWRRAASLPFTREIFRVSGASTDFTVTRAERLDRDTIAGIRSRLQRFAEDAKVRFAFEVLAGQEAIRIHDLLISESDVFIAPSSFKGQPFYEEITRLKCRIRFVETAEGTPHQQD